MFEDLRTAFYQALENFNKELRRDQVPETVDRVLAGMKHDLGDEKAQLQKLEAEFERAIAESQRERDAAATCRRREKMAREIGDEETAKLAAHHAVRHESHHTVLAKKAQAIGEELNLRRNSLAEMGAQLAEAMQKRGSLGATAGRTGAREALSEADELFSELDRMAEKMTGERLHAEAIEELDSRDPSDAGVRDYDVLVDEPQPRERLDVDAALAELKRRMGHE